MMSIFQKQPAVGRDVFVAPNAAVIGDVKLGNSVSVFYGAILRGKGVQSLCFAVFHLLIPAIPDPSNE